MKVNYQPTKFFYFFLLLVVFISCKKIEPKKEKVRSNEIVNYVNHILKRHEIPGVSLAILKNDSLIFKQNFGKANIEHDVSIADKSIFRVYSLTKPIVSVAIFQLIEQGKLSLEDEVSKYVKDLPQTWNSITIKYLLTHSSGLPDMAPFPKIQNFTEKKAKELVFDKDLLFKKGEKYVYNQTNFWLLQKVIEKISEKNIADFIVENQFENNRKNVFFSSDSKKIVSNRVTPYFYFETGEIQIDHPALVGDYMFAANGLNITVSEFLKWDKRLKKNKLLKPETKEKMWQTFHYTKSDKIFAFSWDKRVINNHISYGFSGSLITAYRIFPDDDLSIVFFSNGLGNYYNIENIINHLASLVDENIVDINNLAYEKLSQAIVDGDLKTLKVAFLSIKNNKKFNKVNLENLINDVGYQLINQKRIEKAIQVFTFNTLENPTVANTFDSLAEAYFINKNDSLSAVNYKKAIALGGTNGNAKEMLMRLNQ